MYPSTLGSILTHFCHLAPYAFPFVNRVYFCYSFLLISTLSLVKETVSTSFPLKLHHSSSILEYFHPYAFLPFSVSILIMHFHLCTFLLFSISILDNFYTKGTMSASFLVAIQVWRNFAPFEVVDLFLSHSPYQYNHVYSLLKVRMHAKYSITVADLGWFLGFHGTPLWAGSTTEKVLMIG